MLLFGSIHPTKLGCWAKVKWWDNSPELTCTTRSSQNKAAAVTNPFQELCFRWRNLKRWSEQCQSTEKDCNFLLDPVEVFSVQALSLPSRQKSEQLHYPLSHHRALAQKESTYILKEVPLVELPKWHSWLQWCTTAQNPHNRDFAACQALPFSGWSNFFLPWVAKSCFIWES